MRSIGILIAAGGMALIRASVGFLTFQLLFFLRSTYGIGSLGIAIAGGALGSVLGNLGAPALRRRVSEELMLIGSLVAIAVTGLFTALIGGLGSAVVLSFVVNAAASIGRMAFESIVQRDAPDANQGRVFAQYEAALPAVLGARRRAAGAVHPAGSGGLPDRRVDRRVRHGDGRRRHPRRACRPAAAADAHRPAPARTLRKEVARRRQRAAPANRPILDSRPRTWLPAAAAQAGPQASLTANGGRMGGRRQPAADYRARA